jgi:undecaprenyl-diphosphatase
MKAAILGIVQGLTEFFPISSSAHLRALRTVFGFQVEGLAFDIAVHVATLLAIVIYFRREIFEILRGSRAIGILTRLAVASVPLFTVGYIFGSAREDLSLWVLVGCWAISGTYLLLTRGREGERSYDGISFIRALIIGVAQSLAFLPGMSRSGTTIVSGMLLGMSRESAATFSFLLAIPAILGAGAYQCLRLLRGGESLEGLGLAVTIAMPVAFLVGMIAIHLLLRIVRGDCFYRFGWYNLSAALAFAAYLVW